MPALLSIQFYTRQQCELCHAALAVLKRLQRRIPFQIEIVDIDSDTVLSARYGTVIPVITSGERELARSFVTEKSLLKTLQELAKKA